MVGDVYVGSSLFWNLFYSDKVITKKKRAIGALF